MCPKAANVTRTMQDHLIATEKQVMSQAYYML